VKEAEKEADDGKKEWEEKKRKMELKFERLVTMMKWEIKIKKVMWYNKAKEEIEEEKYELGL